MLAELIEKTSLVIWDEAPRSSRGVSTSSGLPAQTRKKSLPSGILDRKLIPATYFSRFRVSVCHSCRLGFQGFQGSRLCHQIWMLNTQISVLCSMILAVSPVGVVMGHDPSGLFTAQQSP